jgi:hypothetical protein
MGRLPLGVFVLIIALLSASAGALLTWVAAYAFRGGEDKTTREPSEKSSPPSETGELLRVSRTKEDLAVFVQGKPLRHLREITDPEVGRETVAAIRAVLAFAEGWLPTLQEQQGAYRPTSRSSVVSEATSSHQTPGTTQTTYGSPSESSLLEPLRLVEEIDALVQERLRGRPDLAAQGIRLTHDIDGSILIYVGQQSYRSADDIPDDDVRGLIRDAIRAWESR